ncbi:phosphoribosylaminoimidazolesuccinocarboxamide synthase [bacterium]|nr:phosphoribosylaminoimidazolesuccinocarboxamide synthase [bacterium]
MSTILLTQAGPIPKRTGKVRDIYDLGDRLVLVATDRISAFDWILPTGIPDKGKILTAMSLFWFEFLGETKQIISIDLADMGDEFASQPEVFAGRSILVRRTEVFPIECVARGYIAGSAWSEYRRSGTINGVPMPAGLREADPLPEPIFTPATKAPQGTHDENIPFEEMIQIVGHDVADQLRARTLDLYQRARDHAEQAGILLADTKFEFGELPSGEILLVDEALTPDSSRFWPADQYAAGQSPPSYDKQFVRLWLESVGFDKKSPPPAIPDDIVDQTRRKYLEAYQRLTGKKWNS